MHQSLRNLAVTMLTQAALQHLNRKLEQGIRRSKTSYYMMSGFQTTTQLRHMEYWMYSTSLMQLWFVRSSTNLLQNLVWPEEAKRQLTASSVNNRKLYIRL
jgi:hypothetical protein